MLISLVAAVTDAAQRQNAQRDQQQRIVEACGAVRSCICVLRRRCRSACRENSGIDDGITACFRNLTAVFHGHGVAGGGLTVRRSGIGRIGGVAESLHKVAHVAGGDFLPVHIGQRQGASAVLDCFGNERNIRIIQIGIGALGRYRPTAVFVPGSFHGDAGIVRLQRSAVPILGHDLQLRLQRFDDLLQILGFGVQRQNLYVFLGICLRQVILQQVKERIGFALTLKICGGNGRGVILCGQVVDLLQMGNAVFFTDADFCGIDCCRSRHQQRQGLSGAFRYRVSVNLQRGDAHTAQHGGCAEHHTKLPFQSLFLLNHLVLSVLWIAALTTC